MKHEQDMMNLVGKKGLYPKAGIQWEVHRCEPLGAAKNSGALPRVLGGALGARHKVLMHAQQLGRSDSGSSSVFSGAEREGVALAGSPSAWQAFVREEQRRLQLARQQQAGGPAADRDFCGQGESVKGGMQELTVRRDIRVGASVASGDAHPRFRDIGLAGPTQFGRSGPQGAHRDLGAGAPPGGERPLGRDRGRAWEEAGEGSVAMSLSEGEEGELPSSPSRRLEGGFHPGGGERGDGRPVLDATQQGWTPEEFNPLVAYPPEVSMGFCHKAVLPLKEVEDGNLV